MKRIPLFSLYLVIGICTIICPPKLIAQINSNVNTVKTTEQKDNLIPSCGINCVRSEKIGAIIIEGVVGLIGNYNFNEPEPDGTYFFVAKYEYTDTKQESKSAFTEGLPAQKLLFSSSPNPANEWVTVKSCINGTLLISDGVNKVLNQTSVSQEEPLQINISELAAGLYYLQLFDNAGNLQTSQKLIKTNP